MCEFFKLWLVILTLIIGWIMYHLRRGPSEWPLEELQLPGWAHMESICFTKDHLMPFIHYKIHKNNQNYLCVITGPKVVEPALHTQVLSHVSVKWF